jgi:hypothetical protein
VQGRRIGEKPGSVAIARARPEVPEALCNFV